MLALLLYFKIEIGMEGDFFGDRGDLFKDGGDFFEDGDNFLEDGGDFLDNRGDFLNDRGDSLDGAPGLCPLPVVFLTDLGLKFTMMMHLVSFTSHLF